MKGTAVGITGLALVVAIGGFRAALEGGGAAAPLSGRVVTADGSVGAGAMVTARFADGRAVTVYAGAEGGFSLPDHAADAEAVEAWLPGTGRAVGVEPAAVLTLRLDVPDDVAPPASAWLAALPAGEETRRFILDCTGCHVTDATRVRAQGAVRTAEQWTSAVEMMLASFGPGTGFPIVSSWAEPARLGAWAARHMPRGTPSAPEAEPEIAEWDAPPASAVLTEYPVPVPADLPHDLMVAADGTVWITGMFTHQMYRLDPRDGSFATETIPVPNANPRALDIDPSGRVWAVLGGPGQVAIHDPATGAWTPHDVGMYAHSIMIGPDGKGWVNGHFTVGPELIASLDARDGTVRTYEVPPAPGASTSESTIPYGLRVAPDGKVWGTQLRGNRLLRLDPETGAVRAWSMPLGHSGPRRPDLAPDGSVWIPLYGANALARFDPTRESFEVWDFPLPGALPYVVRVDQTDGTVWIGTGHGDVAASFDPSTERFTLYPLPTRGALVRHLDVDEERGEVWFAYGASPGIPGKILRIATGG